MAFAAGALSQVSVSSNSDVLLSAAATGGVGPYTYQWYRSTASGFTPGAGNIISGATSLSLSDSGIIPLTAYYYKVVATDTGNGNATATSSQLVVVTLPSSLQINAFTQSPLIGTIDMRFPYNTIAAQIDVSQVGGLYFGQAVKLVANTAGGVPKVVGCVADSDPVFGFINFDIKTIQFVAGNACEISMAGNVMYLYATGPITQGAQVTLDITSVGGVSQKVVSSGAAIVGWAMDGAAAAGALIRVHFESVPSFVFA